MSTPVYIMHEPFKNDKHRVAIVSKGGKQEVQVLVARGENGVGETNWQPAVSTEEYQAVIDDWAKKAYKDHSDEMDRRHPRGGPDDR